MERARSPPMPCRQSCHVAKNTRKEDPMKTHAGIKAGSSLLIDGAG